MIHNLIDQFPFVLKHKEIESFWKEFEQSWTKEREASQMIEKTRLSPEWYWCVPGWINREVLIMSFYKLINQLIPIPFIIDLKKMCYNPLWQIFEYETRRAWLRNLNPSIILYEACTFRLYTIIFWFQSIILNGCSFKSNVH